MLSAVEKYLQYDLQLNSLMITKLNNVKTLLYARKKKKNKKKKGKKKLTCSQAVPQGIGIRRKNLIPNDTKILPLFLRQKGQRFKKSKQKL